jgi:hypothetical protein
MPPTTEVPIFFGPSESPLFGVVHLPTDRQIRAGVLICRSLGKEGMDSVRIERILAESLALRGFGVLRFDYLGTGDSAYRQVRDDAVSNWVASVGHALEYLRSIGAPTTTAIGIRAGCLILDEYLTQSHTPSPNRVVFFDPVGTGRRYIREHAALYRLAIGEDAQVPGEVSIIGGRISNPAAAEFSALKMNTDPVCDDGVLLVGRPGETDKRLTVLAAAEGVDVITSSRLQECDKPREVLLPVPFDAIDSTTDWIDGKAPTSTHEAKPRYLTTVTMPAEDPDGADVVETIERIEPKGLFAIRTTPGPRGTRPAKTVLFFVTSNDSHVGPAREWVELSRRIAAAGSEAMRWDPAGLGLSGEIHRSPWRRTYSRPGIIDSVAVARHASRDAGSLELVGTCSGAWYAAQTARRIGARSAVLVNLSAWNWRVRSLLLWEWRARSAAMQANTAEFTDGDAGHVEVSRSLKQRLIASIRSAGRHARSLTYEHVPLRVRSVFSWMGVGYMPAGVLTVLARGGTAVTLISCPEDVERFSARGGPAVLNRLQSASRPPRLLATPTGEHAGHHPAIMATIRDTVLRVPTASASDGTPESVGSPIDGRRIR